MTDREGTATMAGRVMFFGALPCTLFLLLFIKLIADREAGHPSGGDALGLMMMSLLSYAANLLTCVGGLVYFGSLAWKEKMLPLPRQWAAILFSLGQVIAAPVYFMSV